MFHRLKPVLLVAGLKSGHYILGRVAGWRRLGYNRLFA
jgi:hypothetical protein